ncbi:MAG: 4Fe-4S dicluster domain-containing protein [Kiritimatiellia bacterium]
MDLVKMRGVLKANAAAPRDAFHSVEDYLNTSAPAGDETANETDAANPFVEPVGRRNFLKTLGASVSVAGLAACTKQPTEKIVPYVDAPEEIIPGRPLFFSTSVLRDGYAVGVLAESHMGRPTKLEGNPAHPASLGRTDAPTQASVLDLYDPDRSRLILNGGRVSDWGSFTGAVSQAIAATGGSGDGLAVLLPAHTSPTLQRLVDEFKTNYPSAKILRVDSPGLDNTRAGAELAFGKALEAVYAFDQANIVLALDADFLTGTAASVRYAADFFSRRRVVDADLAGHPPAMSRLYVVEPAFTATGGAADHRLGARASRVSVLLAAVAAKLGMQTPVEVRDLDENEKLFVDTVAGDLQGAGAKALVVVGETQPPAVHALAHAINGKLGAVGTTVRLIAPVLQTDGAIAPLKAVSDGLFAGTIKSVVFLGLNPVHTAPGDLRFSEAIAKAATSIHLGMVPDETGVLCHWHVPMAHSLETWGDAAAFDGTLSVIQPLIQPLYKGKSVADLLAVFNRKPDASIYEMVQETWKTRLTGDFDKAWRKVLHNGLLEGTASPAETVAVRPEAVSGYAATPAGDGVTLEVVVRPCPKLRDGAQANNAWLQEMPAPVTTVVWDNVALIGLETARRLGLIPLQSGIPERTKTIPTQKLYEIRIGLRSVTLPFLISPGHAENAVTVFLGYGRTQAGRVGNGVGYNVATLRGSASGWIEQGADLYDARTLVSVALLQDHHSMEGRALHRSASLSKFIRHPAFVEEPEHVHGEPLSLYKPYPAMSRGNQWGMVIDLSTCFGCNACLVACQSENSIPTVGKRQCLNGRELHWVRVDRYFDDNILSGDIRRQPRLKVQPVPCMQCEHAPCETVCPAGATMHSNEGLNMMVYNRCIGTRYCANNCPYKVRRFNFLKFVDDKSESLKLGRNPDVTVRHRGVMEKCTYCVQRINEARIEAKKNQANRIDDPNAPGREKWRIADGNIVTACQQACPSGSITFGDILDKDSRVARLKSSKLNFVLLKELNTRPRTSYLAQILNPNPALYEEPVTAGHGGGHAEGHGEGGASAPHGEAPHAPAEPHAAPAAGGHS